MGSTEVFLLSKVNSLNKIDRGRTDINDQRGSDRLICHAPGISEEQGRDVHIGA